MSDTNQNPVFDSRLYNEDLAPVSKNKRTWGTWNYASLWISMSMCIPTYMLASSLIEGGMNWWQSVLTIFLGNLIVLIPMILNGHAGTKIWHSVSCFCESKFWNSRSQYSCVTESNCCLRLVRNPDLDWRRFSLPDSESLDTFASGTCSYRIFPTISGVAVLFNFPDYQYDCGLFWSK